MDMQDTLASCLSYINPDIITIRIKLLIDKLFLLQTTNLIFLQYYFI